MTEQPGVQDPTIQVTGRALSWDELEPLVVRLCNEYGCPDSYPVIGSMVYHESGGRPDAIGDSGHSVGLLQLHDQGLGRGMSVEERMDPEANLRRGIDYHARYLKAYGGDIGASVTAHNAGGAAVNAAYGAGGSWRDVPHHRRADGSVVTVASLYTDPILRDADRYR